MTHLYEVGKPYIPGRTAWPEGVEYNFRAGQHELRLFFRSPSAAEVEAVRTGDCEFALVVEGPVIFLMYRFGRSINWSDSSYTWHLVPEDQRELPETAGLLVHAFLHVILLDAASGLVCALRSVTFSPEFTLALHGAIHAQAEAPWPGNAAYDAVLAAIYRRYPTSADLLKRAIARTHGGA